MPTSEPAKRLHYGWVVVIAFSLLVAGLTLGVAKVGSGFRYEHPPFIVGMTIFATLIFGFFLLLWQVIIWKAFDVGRRWRGRTWVAMLPALLLLLYTSARFIADPPSPQKTFRAVMQVEMPSDAQEIATSQLSLGDMREFMFRCSKQSTLHLIKTLGLEAWEESPAFVSYVAKDWVKADWKDAQSYIRLDKRGTGYILITDTGMERVVVQRHPGFAKSEEELNGSVP